MWNTTTYKRWVDESIVWPKTRWLTVLVLTLLVLTRVVYGEGWYVSLYCLAIFILNLFIAFLTPRRDSETNEYILPVTADGEYRPFERKLPEFQFWHRCFWACALALMSTVTRVFDLPVFWPVLLVYFIFVFVLTMKHQIGDMIQHGYLPWSARKAQYGDVTDRAHDQDD